MHCEDLLLNLCRSSSAQDNDPRIPETFGRASDLLMKSKNTRRIRQRELPSGDQHERAETRVVVDSPPWKLGGLVRSQAPISLAVFDRAFFFLPSIRRARFFVKIEDHQVNEL